MEQIPNMKDYWKEYREFYLPMPEKFSFPLDVFNKWSARTKDSLALFWTDGNIEKKFSFNELKILSSKGAGAFKKLGIKKGDFVKNNTAPYKYPRRIEFVDDLPKTISGKIRRKELKMKEFGK